MIHYLEQATLLIVGTAIALALAGAIVFVCLVGLAALLPLSLARAIA
jgi:hypothetical protein